jgi:hypothetical protein
MHADRESLLLEGDTLKQSVGSGHRHGERCIAINRYSPRQADDRKQRGHARAIAIAWPNSHPKIEASQRSVLGLSGYAHHGSKPTRFDPKLPFMTTVANSRGDWKATPARDAVAPSSPKVQIEVGD